MDNNTMNMPEGFEEPNYGGNKYENWTLKEDSTSVYRILPAMKSLAKAKDYTTFWYTHWWKGRSTKGDGKTRSFPILCQQESVYNNGQWQTTKECPLCVKRAKYLKKVDEIKAAGSAKGASEVAIKKAQAPYFQWLKDHGHDGKYRVYAINRQGQFGVLRLTPTCMRKLRAKVKLAVQNGQTPMGVKGMWWEFTRTGTGFNTEDEVVPFRIERDDGSSILDTHVLDRNTAVAALGCLPDFDEEKEKIRYSEEILTQLAGLQDDNPDEVTRILGLDVQPADDEALGFEAGLGADTVEPVVDIVEAVASAPAATPAPKQNPVASAQKIVTKAPPATPVAFDEDAFAAEFESL